MSSEFLSRGDPGMHAGCERTSVIKEHNLGLFIQLTIHETNFRQLCAVGRCSGSPFQHLVIRETSSCTTAIRVSSFGDGSFPVTMFRATTPSFLTFSNGNDPVMIYEQSLVGELLHSRPAYLEEDPTKRPNITFGSSSIVVQNFWSSPSERVCVSRDSDRIGCRGVVYRHGI